MRKTLFTFSLLFFLFSCSEDNADLLKFTVTGIAPVQGPVGTEVTITGENFPDSSEIQLSFGDTPAEIRSSSSTRIITTVPEGADSGEVSISANSFTFSAPSTFKVLEELEQARIENVHAPQTGGQGQGEIGGAFTKFSFRSESVTESETDWDIAFRGTTIAVNGGVQTGTNDEPQRNGNAAAAIVQGTFDDIISAENLEFSQDAEGAFAIPAGSDNGWYNYNFRTNLVTPIPGVVLVIRTADGRFAKVEILSYYENAPANPDGSVDTPRYYTFRYVYNPNEGETSLAN